VYQSNPNWEPPEILVRAIQTVKENNLIKGPGRKKPLMKKKVHKQKPPKEA
jgi:hypothetical protein